MTKAVDRVTESGNVMATCVREIMTTKWIATADHIAMRARTVRGEKTACEIESNHADISEQRVIPNISRSDIAWNAW